MRGFAILSGSVCAGLLSVATPLHAGSTSGTLDVSLTVLPGCSVSAAPLAFSARAGVAAEADAAIEVRCSAQTGVAVSLDHGRHAAGSQRRLASETGGSVPYAIYTDAARLQAWDADAVIGEVSPGQALRLVAYGRIEPRATAVPVGEYRDSVTVTVAF
jgi:spore coat protein U-like protein